MKICIVVGTRPEIIKMASLVWECQRRNIDHFILHSNQHYSKDMDQIFFDQLGLPAPKYNLNVGSGEHGNQTGNILIKIEPILLDEKPDVILIQGDTNTTMAAGLAASKLQLKVGHVEAGLRSYDRKMPEETNRVITDHMSDYLFAVTKNQKAILEEEGIEKSKIKVVGNTVTDALFAFVKKAKSESNILKELSLIDKKYVLFTSHRASNVDNKYNLQEIADILEVLDKERNFHIVWPMHPRTKKSLEMHGIKLPQNITTTPPLGYLDFINLEANASLIVSDSGGLQEEACILDVPCITIRENTERPETVEVGANILIGRDIDKLRSALDHFENAKNLKWDNPFGQGDTAKKIIDSITGDFPEVDEELKGKKISVIGMGYMGLPMASLLAKAGLDVVGFDIDKNKVNSINSKQVPFEERSLLELLEDAYEKGFRANTKLEPSDVYLIAVPTPMKEQECDLSYVLSAAKTIASVARDGDLVILESTVKPGTCRGPLHNLFKEQGLNIDIVHCPERAIPGNTLYELTHNDRIIGGDNSKAVELAKKIYHSFSSGELLTTNSTTAEFCKLAENTYRDVNIALANELETIAKKNDINIWEAIELSNRHPRVNIHTPGPGVGGHCISIDPWFLAEGNPEAKLIRTARTINDERPNLIAARVHALMSKESKNKIGIMGVAYKKNVDDIRETPTEALTTKFQELGYQVKVFDPYVSDWKGISTHSLKELDEWSDLLVVSTDHDEFKQYLPKSKVVDTRNLYPDI